MNKICCQVFPRHSFDPLSQGLQVLWDKARNRPPRTPCYTFLPMRFLQSLLFFILLGFPDSSFPGESSSDPRPGDQISPYRLMEFVQDLCRFEGRQPGTPGGEAATGYLAHRLPQASLQPFPFTSITNRGAIHSAIRTEGFTKTLRAGKDFIPILALESFQMDMEQSLAVRSQTTQHEITIEMEQRLAETTAYNVIGFLPGSDPILSH